MTWNNAPCSTWAVSDGVVSASTWNTSVLRGVVLVVYGEQAETSARRALGALHDIMPDVPVTIWREGRDGYTDMQNSRWAKVTLLDWSPYTYTAYLDADTQVYQDISAGFRVLEDGYDMVITPSQNQGDQFLWHLSAEEREYTRDALHVDPLQLQAGVMFVARNERTLALWDAWRDEWLRYQDQDQGALLRALHKHPVKVWLLGRAWNGGAIVGHHFGAIRRGA